MTFNEILDCLETDNESFNLFLETYFIPCTYIDEIQIGKYSFKDIYSEFKFSIREYSITHSKVIEEWESPAWRTLFRQNGFTVKQFKSLVIEVNEILRSHTDEELNKQQRREILKKQILDFTSDYSNEEDDPIKYKMFDRLPKHDDYEHIKYTYLDGVLMALREAELHQIQDDAYPVVSKILNLYQEMEDYFTYTEYLEKKKYLKRVIVNDRTKALKKYIDQIRHDSEYSEAGGDEALSRIQWFLFYLIYGRNKIDIFMIHSILGYKYDGAVKLYKKLFLKDHTTGKDNNFLLHRDILSLQYYHLDSELYNLLENISHSLNPQK